MCVYRLFSGENMGLFSARVGFTCLIFSLGVACNTFFYNSWFLVSNICYAYMFCSSLLTFSADSTSVNIQSVAVIHLVGALVLSILHPQLMRASIMIYSFNLSLVLGA